MNHPDDPRRPDPAALLQLAAREHRGKITIFLGMAPGVGKTYAMLERARALKAKGVDVVIGLVETHGRDETAELAETAEQEDQRRDRRWQQPAADARQLKQRPAPKRKADAAGVCEPASAHERSLDRMAQTARAQVKTTEPIPAAKPAQTLPSAALSKSAPRIPSTT